MILSTVFRVMYAARNCLNKHGRNKRVLCWLMWHQRRVHSQLAVMSKESDYTHQRPWDPKTHLNADIIHFDN
eukprot:6172861-Pleurochrysis_carterae.AAC.1